MRPADVDRICRNKMSPCSPSSITKFQSGLWHPPSSGGGVSLSWVSDFSLPMANTSRLSQNSNNLSSCGLFGQGHFGKKPRGGQCHADPCGLQSCLLASSSTCLGKLPELRIGKHTWTDDSRLSHHLECIIFILQGLPKQGLATAKTNTILQQPWMHFQNAKAINQ